MVDEHFHYTITTNVPAVRSLAGFLDPRAGSWSWNAATGTVSLAPLNVGTYTVDIVAENEFGSARSSVTITVLPSNRPPSFTQPLWEFPVVAGELFSFTIFASNEPTSFNATGLPAGLTVNPTNGSIYGRPTTAGTYNIGLTATNRYGTGTATLRLTVVARSAPVITSPLRVSAPAGSEFYYRIETRGEPRPSFFTASPIPPGLIFIEHFHGELRGTPTTPGVYSIALGAETSDSRGTATLELTITPPAPVFTNARTFNVVRDRPFTATLTASGSPTRFGAESLPAGVTLDPATGVLSGTITLYQWDRDESFDFTVTATNAYGTTQTTQRILVAQPAIRPPEIRSLRTAEAYSGAPMTYVIEAINSPTSFTAEGLPAGLTLNSTTGVITGTAKGFDIYRMKLTAANSAGSNWIYLDLTVWGTPEVADTEVSGSTLIPLAYEPAAFHRPTGFSATGLPAGLSINAATGMISGTPTTPGRFVASVTATSPAGSHTGRVTFVLAETRRPTVTSALTATGQIGVPFTYRVTAANNPTAMTASGLPEGLSFDTASATISGTPRTAGRTNITLTASNAAGTDTRTLVLDVGGLAAPAISAPVVAATVGVPLTWNITTSPAATSVSAAPLPAGLALDPRTGAITGIPLASGQFTITYTATNSAGTTTRALTLQIAAVLDTPSDVVGRAVSPTEIHVTWKPIAGAGYYRLERSVSGGAFQPYIETAEPHWEDHTLEGGATYAYRVLAVEQRPEGDRASLGGTTPFIQTPSWVSRDVGSVSAAGSFQQHPGGHIGVTGSGEDIWGRADEFQFVHHAWTGDGILVAQIYAMNTDHPTAKAGVMFRESLAPGARYVMVAIDAAGTATMQVRAQADGETTATPSNRIISPMWVKIVRRGDRFEIFQSQNAGVWTLVGSTTLALPATLLAGCAVTSHRDGVLATGGFMNVSISSTWNPVSPNAPTNFTARRVSPSVIELSWTDNSDAETGFWIEQSYTDRNFTYRPGDYNPPFPFTGFAPANARRYYVIDSAPIYFRIAAFTVVDHDPHLRLTAGSEFAYTFVPAWTGSGAVPTPPTSIGASALSATQVRISWFDNSTNETGFDVQRSTDGVNFSTLATIAANSTNYIDATVAPATTYSYRVQSVAEGAASGFVNSAQVTTPAGTSTPPPTDPAAWTAVDVGAVAAAGSTTNSGETVTMRGSGNDIWDNADEFHFRYRSWTGDGEVTARVNALTDTHPWAKAGIMFRESLTAASRHVFMCASFASGTALQRRITTGGSSESTSGAGRGFPQWVRLVRAGNTFRGYESSDGVTWFLVGTVTLELPSTLFLGLAVTSHQDGVVTTATFDRITATGGGEPPAPPPPATTVAAPTGFTATALSATEVMLGWTNVATNATGIEIERAVGDGAFTLHGTVAANTTSSRVSGLLAATSYRFRVRAVAGTDRSAFSDVASATTLGAPTLPTGNWQSQDIGAVATAGQSSETGGTVTVRASGADIWDNSDEFHYRYLRLDGDGELTVRITSLTNTHQWAKAGIMLRESLAPTSRHAFLCVGALNPAGLQRRVTTGGSSTGVHRPQFAPLPQWLRLVREGNTIAGFVSDNGSAWTPVDTITLELPSSVYLGLAVTSHNDGVICTATFDQVALRSAGLPPPPPPPGTGVPAPTALSATALSSTQVALTWTYIGPSTNNLEVESSTDGTSFTAQATLGGAATSTTVSGLTAATTYHFRIRAVAGSERSGFSNVATSTTPAAVPATPPGDWESRDIGGVAAAGTSTATGGTLTLAGSGADIWDNVDEFHYRFRSWTGDGELVARIDSLSATHPWAKAGVMFRESVSSSARHVFMCASFGSGTALQRRTVAGGGSDSTSGSGWSLPQWLKVVRTGNRFAGFESTDGLTWTRIAEVTVDLPATALVGVAVTSHNDGEIAMARFSQVSVSGGTTPPVIPPPPAALAAPRQLVATVVPTGAISLAWQDATETEEVFQVERSDDNLSYQFLATTPANTTGFTDATAVGGKTYYYRVRASAGNVFSAYSNAAVATIEIPSIPSSGSPWLQGDIGFVGQPGSQEASGNTIILRGSGADIWETTDAFQFLYRAMEGDVTVEAQVTSLSATNAWTKAGVMIRETLAPNARNVFAFLTPANGVAAQHRAATGGTTAFQPGPWGAQPPHWVRLVRRGSMISAYASPDGVTWSLIRTVTFEATRTLYVGFAVTAHDNAQLATAVFTDPYIGAGEP